MATSKERQIEKDKKVDEILEKINEILKILKGGNIEPEESEEP